MGKIRVQDLAKMMGVSNQDLVFKLKSIGVRVEGDDAQIDTDIIQAILTGKKLPHPREVILRDEASAQESAPAGRQRLARRPANPLRPNRPRTMIQRADSRIPTLPSTQKEEEKPAPQAPAAETPAPAAERQAEEIQAREAPAAEEAVAPPAPAAKAEEAPTATAKAKETPAKPAAPRAPAAAAEETDEKKKKKAKARKRTREDKDLKAYKGVVRDLDEDEEDAAAAAKPGERRRRRLERRQEIQQQERTGGKVLSFEKGRPEGPVMISEGMTVRDFADKLGVKSKELIKAMFQRGLVANINQVLEPELAEKLAQDLGVDAMVVSFEEEVQLREEMAATRPGKEPVEGRVTRAPVITVMGHVDHGKTSLLDAVRQTEVAAGEAGGITQHIGAYHVELDGRKIVFLDTPGHEAFTLMRARGTQVTDLVILVVAADDGVMPQTIEAIDHAKAAKVPIIVAINKMDKANANPDRVKKELSDHGLLVEDWGGDIVAVPISALKKEGIDELLEMVLLNADLLDLKANPEISAQGAVVEARKETGRGTVATVLVQNGTLRVGDTFVTGATWGRVRAMLDDYGQRIEQAGPSSPVEVSGFSDLPAAGDVLQVVGTEQEARTIAEYRALERRKKELAPTVGRMTLDALFDKMQAGEVKELPVILKADVQGSLEVLKDSVEKASTGKVKVTVIHAAVGAVTTNDVILASASEAIVIGFNVRPEKVAVDLADKEHVDIRLHTVIYELLDELRGAMTGLLEPTFQEVSRGRAEVRETFKVPKAGTIAGCHVIDGVIPRNAQVRLLRDNRIIYDGKIASLKRFKEDASEVRQGFDCGISLERFQDVKPGDEIEAYVREEVAPQL